MDNYLPLIKTDRNKCFHKWIEKHHMSKHKVAIVLLTLSAFSLFAGCLILLLEIQVYTPETNSQVEQMMNSTIILPCNDSKLQMCMKKSVPAVTLFLQLVSTSHIYDSEYFYYFTHSIMHFFFGNVDFKILK